MLKIGIFSKLSRISIRMLRHYDEIGLLMPNNIDDCTGYRYYQEEQLVIVNRISALKEMGFSLSTIAEILSNYDDSQSLVNFLTIKKVEMEAEAVAVSERLQLLNTAILRLRKDDSAMNYNVIVKTMPQRYVASVRKVIPAYNQEGMLWNILMNETARMNVQFTDDGNNLALFHDDGFKENNVDVEIQVGVNGTYPNTENVIFKTVEPVLIASATYQGSYDQLTLVNQVVASWIQDNGYDFNGMMFCIYHVSPNDTQNPEEYVSEVCYAIKKK